MRDAEQYPFIAVDSMLGEAGLCPYLSITLAGTSRTSRRVCHARMENRRIFMGVGMAFLRQKDDGAWEGDYELLGRGEFGELQDLIFSLKRPLVYLLAYWEDEYDVEINDGPPPYPAQVAESLASDLKHWSQQVRPELLEALRQVPEEEVESYTRPLKRLVEDRLAEGYAIIVSY